MAKRAGGVPAEAADYPTCVRHAKPQKDVKLRHYFLCEGCAGSWSAHAFGGHSPLYSGEPVDGYCQLCNRLPGGVRLRSWFLCEICHRVAGSIGRNHVAEAAILEFWGRAVRPKFPHLELVRNDPSTLNPRGASARAGTAPLDFLAIDERSGEKVFGIENKTGRSSYRELKKFQIDVSDCDCILNEMRALGIPAYVVHAQVLEVWRPPTMGFRCAGLWWTDVYKMAEHFKNTDARRDEARAAAYFGKRAFAPIESFPAAIHDGTGFVLVERFGREGIPAIYRNPPRADAGATAGGIVEPPPSGVS